MTAVPHFRLLLHGQDGSIPYLTPELMRLIFCPPNGVEDTTPTSNVDGDLQQSWKWHLDHLILGVAVKDTCVTAVYRDIKSSSSDKKKRKSEQNGGSVGNDRSAKKVKSEQIKVDDVPSSNTQKSADTTHTTKATGNSKAISSSTSSKQQPSKSNGMNTKKPAGYTFLTPSQSAQICKEINSHINCKTTANGTSTSTNYMQTYLRIPQYISTLIVPTFTLDSPDTNKSAPDVKSSAQDVNKNKHVPKQSSDNKQSKPKQQQKKKDIIPNSTKDSIPVDTPHGWQKIKPEQYVDAVTSLTTNSITSSSATGTASNDKKTAKSLCVGAVGLFDHLNTSRDQANCMFVQFTKDKSGGEDDKLVLTPQAQKSIEGMVVKGKWETMVQKLVQRTNDWSIRTANYKLSSPSTAQTMPFWLPIHMAASHLPLKYMFSCPRSNPQEETQSVLAKLSNYNHVAITGWDSISYNREYRRQALRQLMTTLQQTPTSITSTPRRREYLILAVNDIQSILDAAREGVSIIGTDMVRLWSRDGMALCLDMSLDNEVKKKHVEYTTSGMIDLSDEKYARDSSALLPGCQCVSCRPRQINTRSNHLNIKSTNDQIKKSVPSFTRAYIHHLIKANEMLAETLLFVHNLHQMLLLFRQLSQAASLDEEVGEDEEKRNLEAFCQKVEEQLLGL